MILLTTSIKSIVTFETIGDAMAFESLANDKKILGRLLPVPHSLSTGCGIAWLSDKDSFQTIKEELENAPYLDAELLLYDSSSKQVVR